MTPSEEERQRQRELASHGLGADRYEARVLKLTRKGEVKRLQPWRKIIRQFAELTEKEIEQERSRRLRLTGPRPAWVGLCEGLASEELAKIAVEEILSACAAARNRAKFTMTAHAVGRAVEWRLNLKAWVQHDPSSMKSLLRYLKKTGATSSHKETVLKWGFNKNSLESKKPEWSAREQIVVGIALILAAVKATGRIRITLEKGYAKYSIGRGKFRSHPKMIELDEETLGWLDEAVRRGRIRSNVPAPMCIQPRPWSAESVTGEAPPGGYLIASTTGHMKQLVVGRQWSARMVRQAIKEDPAKIGHVLKAVNFLGRTAWRINRKVLAVALRAHEAGIKLPGLPDALLLEEPPKPHDIETNEEARRKWRRSAFKVKAANMKASAKFVQASNALEDAKAYAKGAEDMFFPHYLDYRGRMYPAPQRLNVQGPDLQRALLEFAEGAEITDRGAWWLAQYVGKMFDGGSRKSFEDRIAWAYANEDFLRRLVSDPLGNIAEWQRRAGEDGIWMALAAAFEWVGYRDALGRGEAFVTHLPIFIDGSANVVQHYVALARDPALAELVNLTPSDRPRDLYQTVADQVFEAVEAKAKEEIGWTEKGAADVVRARKWLKLFRKRYGTASAEGRLPRSFVKGMVMGATYGATSHSILEHVTNVLDDKLDPQWKAFPDGAERVAAKTYLSRTIDAVIRRGPLKSALRMKDWLRAVAKVLAKRGAPVSWAVPVTGWPLRIGYAKDVRDVATSTFAGETVSANMLREDSDNIGMRKQLNAVPASIIHALDAATMAEALNVIEDAGVRGAAAIHDCVGGLCTDMDVIAGAVREGFVRVHSGNPMQNLYEAALEALSSLRRARSASDGHDAEAGMIPKPPANADQPKAGTMRLEQDVRRSVYFFG